MISKERAYDLADVKALMENTRDRASRWDDLLHYLEGPSNRNADTRKTFRLADDIRLVRNSGHEFTTDYRQVWEALTGEAPGEDADLAATEPTPSRVHDILRRVQSREYRELAGLTGSNRPAG